MDCFSKFNCRGICCYDGVYLEDDDIRRINECIKKYPQEFADINYIEISNWKSFRGLKKTKSIKLKRYRKDYPKHFSQTRCIFQIEDTGNCLLQEIALKHDENKWKYKPRTCCIFPLRRRNGKLELLINKKDDPNVYDDYNGYESCLPCFKKIKYNELEEEYRYYNNQ